MANDSIISVTIAGATADEFRAAFVRAHPLPPAWAGTFDAWIKRCVVAYLRDAYRAGRLRQMQQSLEGVNDIIRED